MALSPTDEHPQAAYSPDANSHGRNPPPQRSPFRRFAEYSAYAGVRAPQGESRNPMGPFGANAAVSVNGFEGYPVLDKTAQELEYQSILRQTREDNAIRARRQGRPYVETPANAPPSPAAPAVPDVPDVPVVRLGPGSDPPPPRDNREPIRNSSKYLDADTPERFEQFLLADGEKKCTQKADTRKNIPPRTLHRA